MIKHTITPLRTHTAVRAFYETIEQAREDWQLLVDMGYKGLLACAKPNGDNVLLITIKH